MAKDTANAIRLLSALELLPLEKCTSDAAEWRQEIADAIADLQGGGLPADDPLRYQDGEPVSEERLQRRLQTIIEKILDDISFTATDRGGEKVIVDKKYVETNIGELVKDTDLSKFIL